MSSSNRVILIIAPLLTLWVAGLVLLSLALAPLPVLAQGQVETYTVQAGDTLGLIADQFGVTVDDLVAANQLPDANILEIGQVLIIPKAGSAAAPSEWTRIVAYPRQTLASLAAHYGLEVNQLAAYNKLRESTRLFPGQPIRIPTERVQAAGEAFGALRLMPVTTLIDQGRTGVVQLQIDRPVRVNVVWNGLPLPLIPETGQSDPTGKWFAPIPVPALIALGTYPLEIGYTTTAGAPLTRTLIVTVRDGGYDSQAIVLDDEKSGLLAPELVQTEEARISEIWAQVSPSLMWTGVFSRPITSEYATTSPFGTRRSYNGGPLSSYHAGQDFGAPADVPVYAPAGGTVVLAEALTVRGNAVIIDHGRGIFTGYWHLNAINVQPGQGVQPGDQIGVVGTTGLSTGNHLHWELRIFGIAVDPMPFLHQNLLGQFVPGT